MTTLTETAASMIHRFGNGRWGDAMQVQVLAAFLTDHCQLTDLQQFLNAVVKEENKNIAATPVQPAVQQIRATVDATFNTAVMDRLAYIQDTQIQNDNGVIAIDAFVRDDSYNQIRNWLSLESALPGFGVDGEVIFGYLVKTPQFDIIVALTNSPHGPWLDAWVHTEAAGMESSPPPINNLADIINFERPTGNVTLQLHGPAS